MTENEQKLQRKIDELQMGIEALVGGLVIANAIPEEAGRMFLSNFSSRMKATDKAPSLVLVPPSAGPMM